MGQSNKKANEKDVKGDILNIVEQFITYFEQVDKEEKDDYSVRSSTRNSNSVAMHDL